MMTFDSCMFYGWKQEEGFVIVCDDLNESADLANALDDRFKDGETEWTTHEDMGRISVQRRSNYHPHIAQAIRDVMED